ncbi:MAG: transcription termination/antitermination factor NusG [Gemmatimonadetes bacterium]|nr:transcription termination/antitermination factor NusG [Gemmatimonadota bacterium]
MNTSSTAEGKAGTAGTHEARWYAIQTYAGHENKVKTLVQRRIAEEPRVPEEKEIRRVLVPTQDVVEIKGGKRVTKTRRLYPGYVLVEMVLNQRTLHVINNLQGVIKFVGSGAEPQPLRQDEINKILGIATAEEEEAAEAEIPFRIGQVVEVMEGPFKDFSGKVDEVFPEKGKVKVQVSLFGRPTSIELDYTQLKGY